MKKFILVSVLNLIVYAGFSQSTFSILSYSLQESWYAKQTGENTELLKKGMESANCKIVFFKPVKIFTNDVATYEKYRNDLTGNSGLTITSSTKVKMESTADWTSFSGLQNVGAKGNAYSVAFYSISNTTQTVFFAVYSANDEACTNDLDSIVQSVNLTETGTVHKDDRTKAKAKPASKKVRIAALKSLKGMVN